MPGDPHDKMVAFNFNIIDPNAAKGYMVADLFDPARASQAGRQMPNLYQPTESQVALVRMQLPTLDVYERSRLRAYPEKRADDRARRHHAGRVDAQHGDRREHVQRRGQGRLQSASGR